VEKDVRMLKQPGGLLFLGHVNAKVLTKREIKFLCRNWFLDWVNCKNGSNQLLLD
jgi:hypothetical protein